MKQKPKKSLSPLQQRRLWRISVVAGGMIVLWLVFSPGRGLFHLHQQKKHLAVLEAERAQMIAENKEMMEAIERLQNDRKYLEQIAREQHGMLKDNEMVFDFAKKKQKKE